MAELLALFFLIIAAVLFMMATEILQRSQRYHKITYCIN